MSRAKTAFAVFVLLVVLGCSIWQKLQVVAAIALVGVLALTYRDRAVRVVDFIVELIGSTRQAKYGALEIQLERRLKDFSELAIRKSAGLQILLSNLDSEHLSLLLAISKAGHYKPPGPAKKKLRDLRNRGLLFHDGASLGESEDVWLSPLGVQLAELLMESPVAAELGKESVSLE